MEGELGWIVRATAGRDMQGLFCVVGTQPPYLLLADGKRRKLAKPKRKRAKHVQPMSQGQWEHPAIDKLKQGEPVSDRHLRRALAAFQGGNHAWRKTI